MEVLYVAQGCNGLLKVGRTANTRTRVVGLRKEFKSKGDTLSRFVHCAPTTNGYYAEKLLLKAMHERLPVHSGREWFHGGLFENAERAAKEVSDYVRETEPYVKPKTREEREAHKAKWAAYWAPIKAAEKARKDAYLAAQMERDRMRNAIVHFRATVCARIAATLTADEPTKSAV
jgi:hypothetical protein